MIGADRALTVGRRVTWGLADQVLSSVTNFALTVAVARSASSDQFGSFAITLATYLLVVGIGQGLVSQPFAVRHSASDERSLGTAVREASGAALVLGIVAGAACAVVGAAAGGSLRPQLVALGLSLPGLLLQDAWRFLFVAMRRPERAALNDAVWVLAQTGGFALLLGLGRASPASLLAAWGAAGSAGAVLGCWQARRLPNLAGAVRWLDAHRELGLRFAAQAVVIRGAAQLMFMAIAGIAGLGAAGLVRGAQVVFSPLTLLYQALIFAAVPEGVRTLRSSPRWFPTFTLLASVGATVPAVVWGLLALLDPGAAERQLLGSLLVAARPLLPALVVQTVAGAVSLGPQVALRALGAARRGLAADATQALLLLVAGSVGALLGGARGAAEGISATAVIGAAVWWLALVSARDSAAAAGWRPARRFRSSPR